MPVESQFDALASSYDAWFATPLGNFVFQRELDLLLRTCRLQGTERVLEVGCGTGAFTRELAKRAGQTTGIDPSTEMLGVAASRVDATQRPFSLLRGRGEALPFRGNSFDVVVSITVLEFVHDPSAVIADMARVARPGGLLVAAVLNKWSLWAVQRKLAARDTIYEKARFFSPTSIQRLMEPYGSTEWRTCVFVPPWTSTTDRRKLALIDRCAGGLLSPFGAFLVCGARIAK